jgi:Cu/Ag efflux protein CusF
MIHLREISVRAMFRKAAVVAGICVSVWLTGCSSPKPAQPQPAQTAQPAQGPQRYSLQGRVVSVEKAKQQVVVDHGEIPGFMMAMTMGYSVKNANQLDPLSPEDQITADVVVNGNDVWLENIVVVKKASAEKSPSASESKPSAKEPAKQ